MNRILLVKTSSLGDVVHNLPVINDILSHNPDAQIDWLVEESFASIPKMHPKVNRVITVATRRWRKHLFDQKTWDEIAQFKSQLGQETYDMVIDTQGLLKSAVMARYANGPKAGFDRKTVRERLAALFYQYTFQISREKHAVDRNRLLAASALGYALPSIVPDYGIQANSAASIDLPEHFVIGLHGTSKAAKLWPSQHWVGFAHAIAAKDLTLILPWADEAEQARATQIAQAANNVLVLPKCNISTLAQIINQSRFAVGVDTGLSHLAAALNKPVLAIYTDTKPSRTGVLAGQTSPAINLGGVGQIPSIETVMDTVSQLS